MMKKAARSTYILITAVFTAFAICACNGTAKEEEAAPKTPTPTPEAVSEPAEPVQPEATVTSEDDYTEGLGDTFSGQTEEPDENSDNRDVDLIFFMGQSNMSGAAGDASLAPHVPESAGMEFRAVSDPSTLYPITEPFGINENDPSGLHEFPGAKKGSLVSAFVNEYHELTGRRVIAVSISMGATDMKAWMSPGAVADVKTRYDRSLKYLKDNGYNVGHIYALWLHGESDAIEGTDPGVYRTDLDDIMRPLFIGGLQKVFIITPGRTIDYKDIFLNIIDMQKQICAESGYYAIGTTVLTGVSTEYMRDQYHYNQHVLNLVGIETARSVAYYMQNGVEKIVYDYRKGEYIIPAEVDPDSQEKEEPIDLSSINIDEVY
ncbi:MAG: sialate O-acetylesterase [Lachnospiraceae bacterium]|nr:sialate O-acetylesterase [Lachnospiraceae bacterium]